MYKNISICLFYFLLCAHHIQAAQETQARQKVTPFVQDPRMAQNKDMSHYVASLQTKFPHATEAFLKNHINEVLNTKSNQSTWIPWKKTPTMTPEDVLNYEPSQSNPRDVGSLSFTRLIENNDLMRPNPLQADRTNSIVLFNKSLNDTQLTSPTEQLLLKPASSKENITFEKTINKIYNAESKNSTLVEQQIPVTTTVRETLSNLWKNSKVPTTSEIKTALNKVYETLQKTFKIKIPEPIKNRLFKQAQATLPNGKDPKQIDSWSKSIQKTIYQWTLNLKTSWIMHDLKTSWGLHSDDFSTLEQYQGILCCTKYATYETNLDMYKVIHPTVTDIANSLSNSIAKDIIGDQTISQKDMGAIHKKFAEQFTQWTIDPTATPLRIDSTPLLKKSYETLGLEQNTTNLEQVTKSYRKLSLKNHPDKRGDAAKFQEISNAYEAVSNAISNATEQQKSSISLKTPTELKHENFNNLINILVTDINNAKEANKLAEQSLRDLSENKFNETEINSKRSPNSGSEYTHQDSQNFYKIIINKIIKEGKATRNENGTTTYTMLDPHTQKSIFVTVDNQGKITNMNNITNLGPKSWWNIFD
ncbi:MAG: DnaJ domain-containing protein [Candidatus Chromulinivorax sp.]|nr:DnaJ domain-containing protein [Candidatus Chromulinivorax sp.]